MLATNWPSLQGNFRAKELMSGERALADLAPSGGRKFENHLCYLDK
jgi:hypothetical protein